MAFNITNFIGSMGADGARPNLFTVSIPSGFAGTDETFQFRAKASSIPGSRVGVAPAFYFGRQAKFAGNRVFDDWTVTVMVDETDYGPYGPRYELEKWAGLLNTHVGNVRNGSYVAPADYMRDGVVTHWTKAGKSLAVYGMIQCFPIDISPIGLDWGANDTIEEFTVTFAMQYWTSISSGEAEDDSDTLPANA